jgi:pimeloyl-ACP methyl ester carboxylesterase
MATVREPAARIELQDAFNELRAEPLVQRLPLRDGRTASFIDEGRPSWRPFVIFGGLGTSLGAVELLEFARTARERLGLRVVSVERNGFGETPFDPDLGYGDAADDVLAVLEWLGIHRFAIVGISGGGPFAAALAARVPERVTSIHLAAAAAGPLIATSGSASSLFADPEQLCRDPQAFWEFPPDSPVHRIPGFAEAAAREGVRSLGRDGRGAVALAHEWQLLCAEPLPDLSALEAPAHLYWGLRDQIVPLPHAARWRECLPNVVAVRCYPGEGHDVHYRHWDQILLDVSGLGARKLICRGGRTWLVPGPEVDDYLSGGATLGICPWAASGSAGPE